MNELGISLLWCAGQVTAVAVLAGVLYVAARRMGSAARSLVALTSLAVAVALSAFALSPWPRWWDETSAEGWQTDQETGSADDGEPNMPSRTDRDSTELVERTSNSKIESLPVISVEFLRAVLEQLRRAPVESESEAWRWPGIVTVLFLAGLGTGMLRLLAGLLAVRTYRRRSRPVSDTAMLELVDVLRAELQCPRRVEIRESDLLVTAATIGWRCPQVLLPAEWTNWTEQERRAVLAHEIAHICRSDFPAWLCAQLGLALHFYHPLVHWLAGRLRLEQELAADAAAAGLTGGHRPYLTILAQMALRQADRRMSWPARTFLPTRRTFLRRIEMLRDAKQLTTTLSRGTRFFTITLVALAGLAAAGFRRPASSPTNVAQAEPPRVDQQQNASSLAAVQPNQAAKRFDLSYVPSDATVVIAARPADIFGRPEMKLLATSLNKDGRLESRLGVSVEGIEQVTLVGLLESEATKRAKYGMPYSGIMIRTLKPHEFESLRKAFTPDAQGQTFAGKVYYKSSIQPERVCYFKPDRRTIIFGLEPNLRRLIHSVESGASRSTWAKLWKNVESDQVAVALDLAALRQEINRELLKHEFVLLPFSPLWQQSKIAVVGVSLDKGFAIKAVAACENQADADKVKQAVEAVVPLVRNMLSSLRQRAAQEPAETAASMFSLIDFGEELLKQTKVQQKKTTVRLTARLKTDATGRIVAVLLPAVQQAREAAYRAQSRNNLKQLGFAFHAYHHDGDGHFPPAVVIGPDGKTPHSWRVELLPFLDQQPLYKQYKMDEPWDSENNKKVLAKMPAVFRDPKDAADSTNASYFALVGANTVFSGKEGTRIRDITDGTSNTIMVVEAKRKIPWTKPEDISYDPKQTVPKLLGGFHQGGFHIVLCDGSVRFVSENIDENTFRALITKDGGEIVGDF